MEDERREGGDQQGGLHGAGQAGPGHGRAVGECPLSGVWTSGGECPLWVKDVQGGVSAVGRGRAGGSVGDFVALCGQTLVKRLSFQSGSTDYGRRFC